MSNRDKLKPCSLNGPRAEVLLIDHDLGAPRDASSRPDNLLHLSSISMLHRLQEEQAVEQKTAARRVDVLSYSFFKYGKF